MKTRFTILFSTLFFLLNAQNIIDNKVSFQYIQLPKIKIDEAIETYFISYKNSFASGNERQNVLHQLRVDSAEKSAPAPVVDEIAEPIDVPTPMTDAKENVTLSPTGTVVNQNIGLMSNGTQQTA